MTTWATKITLICLKMMKNNPTPTQWLMPIKLDRLFYVCCLWIVPINIYWLGLMVVNRNKNKITTRLACCCLNSCDCFKIIIDINGYCCIIGIINHRRLSMKLLTYIANILVLIKIAFIDSVIDMKQNFLCYLYPITMIAMPFVFITLGFTMDSVNNLASFLSLAAMVTFIIASSIACVLLCNTMLRVSSL